ncbi:MAG: NAD+ synthase [Candidatus Bathyarchaeia archaeon]
MDVIKVPEIDFEKTISEIVDFIRGEVEKAGAAGVVLGLSGGIDSSLTAALCVRALGGDKVLGVIMPTSFTPKEDLEDALEVSRKLNMKTILVNIDDICETIVKALKVNPDDPRVRMPLANVRARVRMLILYFYANLYNYLVVGTSDRSEYLIGYFTKYGDGAADFFPIRHLYKTQVRELAAYMGLPERIVKKPSSPQLYPGHRLLDEVPADYSIIDPILVGLFEKNLPADKVSEILNVQLEIVNDVKRRYMKSMHKRLTPPMIEAKKPPI